MINYGFPWSPLNIVTGIPLIAVFVGAVVKLRTEERVD